MKFIIPLLTLYNLYIASSRAADTTTVNTPSGDVIGIGIPVSGLNNSKTYQFRKIPYAKPPVGNLRFAKPQPYGSWQGVLNATEFGPSCIQQLDDFSKRVLPNTDISEDCLFLNIYVPNKVNTTKIRPAMVWIHGGAYLAGQGMLYDAGYMAVKGDVIIVTINYRLGFFGFMTLGSYNTTGNSKLEEVRGNFGLWDQIAALRWVSYNIASFGGDPHSLTIFGESAGGFSVSLLSLIPQNKNLFHRVIAQSGFATSFDAMSRVAIPTTYEIGFEAGCKLANPDSFLICLRQKPAEELLNATFTVLAKPSPLVHLMLPLGPVVDHELFQDFPENLLQNNSSDVYKFFTTLQVIIGNVNSEGSLIIDKIIAHGEEQRFHFDIQKGLPYSVFCDYVVKSLCSDYFDNNTDVSTAICQEYEAPYSDAVQAQHAVDLYTDLYFLSRTISSLRTHATSGLFISRYQYVFTRDRKHDVLHDPGALPSWFQGASHGSELQYLFGMRDSPYPVPAEDLTISDNMITYWTNFAWNGDPNMNRVSDKTSRPNWPIFNSFGKPDSYLILDVNITSNNLYHLNRMEFWLNTIPSMLLNSTSSFAATTTTTPPLPQRSDISCNADSIDTFVPISMLPSGAPLTWRDPTCSVTSNGTHMISSIGLSQCGTTVTITKDNVEFENELKAQSTNSTANSLIDFGEDAYVIPVKCIYPRTETPMTSYVPLQQHVRFYEKRYGHFDVDIMQYDSDKFSSAIQNLGTPRKVALNSEIYVEVKLNDQFNNGLGIHIDKCIATPTSSPSDSTLYTLLTDGCPASQHVHLYNSPANKVRFGVRAFQFTSQTGAMVYIHCQTSMCQAGTPYCTSNCVTAGRRKRDVAPDQKSHLVSAGPFVLVADEQGTPIRMSTIVASVSAFVAVVACVVAIVGWTRKTRTTSTKEQGLL